MDRDQDEYPRDMPDDVADVDDAVIVGATTSSHPANANDVDINRSGSGGTGGAGNDEDDAGDGGGGQKD
jgi:hypothetical protein